LFGGGKPPAPPQGLRIYLTDTLNKKARVKTRAE
jgi:hypothetical protein